MSEQDPRRQMPEFIDLEKEEREFRARGFQERIPRSLKLKVRFHTRVLCLLASFVSALYTLGGAILTLFFLILSLVTFWKVSFLSDLYKDCKGRMATGAVVTLGLFVSFFNPSFGLVIVMAYFMMGEEDLEQSVVGRAIHSHFRDYL